jgi:hypothetical protein
MNVNREDKIVYVRVPLFFKDEMAKSFEKILLEMGMHDATPSGTNTELLHIAMKYWAINISKKIFVGTSKDYGNKTINTDEFTHQYRGRILTKKFGI